MSLINDILAKRLTPQEIKDNRCVVRLTTGAWHNRSGVFQTRSLKYLRTKGKNVDLLDEECNYMGASDVLERLINFSTSTDGIYQIVTCNHSTDWETGYVDGYDLKLIPFIESP
jgi:hypothetical protein